MKEYSYITSIIYAAFFSASTLADGFVEGIPVSIQKSDYSSLHLIYIQLDRSVTANGCSNNNGLVVLDTNESSKAALSFALTAQASGKKFRCYVIANQCSAVTGSAETYPICGYYPTIAN